MEPKITRRSFCGGAGGSVEQFQTRRSALILARLALSRNASISRDALAEELWPEDFIDATRLRLRQELKRLRDALGDAKELVQTDRTWIRLDLDSTTVDVREFERAAELGSFAEDDGRRLELLKRALDLYAGPLLPEFNDPWVLAARMELRDRFSKVEARYIQELEESGDHLAVVNFALQSLRKDPNQEPIVLALSRAQQALGNLDDAKKTLTDYERSADGEKSREFRDAVDQLRRFQRGPQSPVETPSVVSATHEETFVENDLPAYFDSFVGRGEERRLLRELLLSVPANRLVTLAGPGGVGKTRLASEVANELVQKGSHVIFLSAEQTHANLIEERLRDLIPAGRSLVFLDNAESSISEVRTVLSRLMREKPDVQFLVTSRQKIAIGGERCLQLAPIEPPTHATELREVVQNEAAQLFLQRVKAADPRFELDASHVPHLIALLQRLEGLPLAMELAAAQVGDIGIAEASRRIDDRFTFLVTHRIDLPERQQSIWAAIDWSYRNLDDNLRDVLHALAVCPAGCSGDTAVKYLGADAVQLLQGLRDRSMLAIQRDEAGVKYQLAEAVREFALSHLDETKRNELLAKFAASLIEGVGVGAWALGSGWDVDRYRKVAREFPNVLAIMQWSKSGDVQLGLKLAAMCWRYWCYMGHRREGQRAMRELLGTPGLPNNQDQALCLFGAAFTAYIMGQLEEAKPWFQRSYEMHKEIGQVERLSWIELNRAAVAYDLGDFRSSLELADHANELFLEQEDSLFGQSLSLAEIGKAQASLGNLEAAKVAMDQALAIRMQIGNESEIGRSYTYLGYLYREIGDWETALRMIREGERRLEISPNMSYQLIGSQIHAETCLELGLLEEGFAQIEITEDFETRLGAILDSGHAGRMRSQYFILKGDFDRARNDLREALQRAINSNQTSPMADGVIATASILAGQGRLAEAESLLKELISVSIQTERPLRPSQIRRAKKVVDTFDFESASGSSAGWTILAAKAISSLI